MRREKPGNIKQIGIKMIKTRLKEIWKQSLLDEFGEGKESRMLLKGHGERQAQVCNHVLG